MSDTAFHCSSCGHSADRHTVTRWPSWTKFCRDCGCTGYSPRYKYRETNEDA